MKKIFWRMKYMKFKNYTIFEMPSGEGKIAMMALEDVKAIVKSLKIGCSHCQCKCVKCEDNNCGN